MVDGKLGVLFFPLQQEVAEVASDKSELAPIVSRNNARSLSDRQEFVFVLGQGGWRLT